MSKFIVAIFLSLSCAKAFAGIVHRFEFVERSSGLLAKERVRTLVIDLWEGSGERVLIAAGYHVEDLSELSQFFSWSRRKLISSDVQFFEDLSNTDQTLIRIEMGEKNRTSPDLVIRLDLQTLSVEAIVTETDELISGFARSSVILERDYRAPRIAGQPMIFESGNSIGVPWEVFFRSKATQWRMRKTFPRPALFERQAVLPGHEKEIEALLDFKEKPRINDMIALTRNLLASNPAYDLKNNPFSSYLYGKTSSLSGAMEEIPAFYQKLEQIFPGAKRYFLGRDIYLLGDALEAYDLTLNQTGRVERLPASAPSFKGADLSLIDGFLKTHGINVDEMTSDSAPIVILDVTSYSDGSLRLSQSRHLMRAAYQRWQDLGRDPKLLARKMFFVNVSDAHRHPKVEVGQDLSDFFDGLSFAPEPLEILTISAPVEFQYTMAWHGLYEPFMATDSGVVTTFGPPSTRSTRLELLGELWAIVSHFGPKLLTPCESQLKGKSGGKK